MAAGGGFEVIPPAADEPPAGPAFLFDLGSAECYLAAELIAGAGLMVEWRPVDGALLAEPPAPPDRDAVERAAAALELQPLRWPPALPPDSRRAMLAATFARDIGRVVAFSMAAFRQAFAGGRDLAEDDTLLIAGAACEIHPSALLKSLARAPLARSLDEATAAAAGAGVRSVPALLEGERLLHGYEPLARALGGQPATSAGGGS